ncbi:hypothetical protein ACLIJT_11725 [Staphylococcus gallinarum]
MNERRLELTRGRGERENEERCERLATCQKSALAPMVADLHSARVG